ncbi:putative RDD family membrane protein YckC [Virgibacillus halotolerans]|uniref:RDD family protein n=1 Tax=Virgibacillus halotolerans TaxID=1071053 RepID=UPI00195F655C|nr:RDD family protein [Virgibacillus halotolerans]MBM7600283.1 putative RDD family membrane protein YckC [Virgibacillus halotolerans]
MSEEQTVYTTSENTPPIGETRYAGFWMRFWAYLADLIVIFSISGILLIPFQFINDGKAIDIGFWTVTGIIGAVVYYVYFLLMTKYFSQTLGKMIFGIKVIRGDHQPLKWGDLLFREVIGRFIQRVFFITMFLYLVVAFNTDKQGIHDMIGNTKVVFTD